jgi:hypothetical protein
MSSKYLAYKLTKKQRDAYIRAEQLINSSRELKLSEKELEKMRVEYHQCLKKLWEVTR